jgi:hypothetical protein
MQQQLSLQTHEKSPYTAPLRLRIRTENRADHHQRARHYTSNSILT